MNRQQALSKIRKAYENKQLGFQKGATICMYYDKKTNSHCAVGVLIGKKKSLMDEDGNIEAPFTVGGETMIGDALCEKDITSFCGLSKTELTQLQRLHDNIINCCEINEKERKDNFKTYLYSLN